MTAKATLALRLWPRSANNVALRNVTLVLAGTLLLAVSAHIQVPFWPVKMSMQSFVIVALGLAYGPRLAAATVVAYLVEGAAGLPVFQSGAGIAYFAGPTGGYLLGFVLAAYVVGLMAERGACRTLIGAVATVLAGEALIYLPGVIWLSYLLGPETALSGGLLVFMPAEALKAALAVALALKISPNPLRGQA